jgi:FKBP-type peptidyl-prolyl cis-trans isomerase SlyD
MTEAPDTVAPNRFVSLEYTLRDEQGELLDESEGDAGIDYVHGYGMLVPGLESALRGLKAGDQREIIVPAASGYGEHQEDLVMELDRSELPNPEEVAEGDEFIAEWPGGEEVPLRVVLVKDDSVVVDGNHPLAGIALCYSVKVRSVREATEEEIESAARDLADAEEHEHGPDCDHDHSHDQQAAPGTEQLLTLGKRKSSLS